MSFISQIFQAPWAKIPNSMFATGRVKNKFIPIVPSLSAIAALGYMYSRNSRPILPNLEAIYQDMSHVKLDILSDSTWDQYLEPNEYGVQTIINSLKTGKKGILVSTGTERSFFDLLLRTEAEPENSLGLMIVDVNPKAIAYTHMVILLLRLADDITDFSNLSGPNRATKYDSENITCTTPFPVHSVLKALTEQEIGEKIKCIRERILKSKLSEKNKKFYLENLTQFAQIYFQRGNEWRLCGGEQESQKHWESYESVFSQTIPKEGCKELSCEMAKAFKGVQYHKEASQFKILQRFARAGSIVPICGNINELHFLKDLQTDVSIIDISNIDEYCAIDLNASITQFSPRVIWSERGFPTKYHSYEHKPSKDFLTPEEKQEFDSLIKQLMGIGVLTDYKTNLMFQKEESFIQIRPFGYYPENLSELRDYMKRWVVTLPNIGTVSFGPTLGLGPVIGPRRDYMKTDWINKASRQQLLNIVSHPQIQVYSTELVKIWREKRLHEKYFLFSEIPGWKEAFIQEREKHLGTPEWEKFEQANRDKICRIIS